MATTAARRPYQPYDYQQYEQYLAEKAKEAAQGIHNPKRKAVPIEFGQEYGTLLERQQHEHEEIRRRELMSRGRAHPAKDIYLPTFWHKTEQKMMQTKRRPQDPINGDELALSLAQQQKEKEDRDREAIVASKQPSRFPFPRMTKGELPLFPTRGKAPPRLSKEEYAATLKAMIAVKQGALKEDEVMGAVSTPGGSLVPITGSQALMLTSPSQMARVYPGRVGIQHNLYHSVIANAAYPPKTPIKPAARGRAHPPTPGNYHRVVFSTQTVIDKVRSLIKSRGDHSFNAIKRSFKIMDNNGNGLLSPEEFKWGLFEFGLRLSDTEVATLTAAFDLNGDGAVSLSEFVREVRGPMDDRRRGLVETAFSIIDRENRGVVNVNDLAGFYNVDLHPKVASGEMTKEQALLDFLNTFDPTPDGSLTRDDFVDYYANISAAIDSDDYFELMVRNAWHMSGGQGWCENSSNLRVLVTYHDNTEEVLEIANDLGLNPNNPAMIRAKLVQQGINNIKRVSVGDAVGY